MARRFRKTICTFLLVVFAWIFFVSSQLRQALLLIRQMTTSLVRIGDMSEMGLNMTNWKILLTALLILLVVDLMNEKGCSVCAVVQEKPVWLRWVLYLGLLWSVLLFGIYGAGYDAGAFIYFQF